MKCPKCGERLEEHYIGGKTYYVCPDCGYKIKGK